MNNYFYIDANGQQCGPVAGESLQKLGVTKDSLVWCDGMSTWEKAGSVSELSSLFVVAPPVPPTPPAPSTPVVSPTPDAPKSAPVKHVHRELCPDNNLVWAILVTLMCCQPFGIPAIVNASKVELLWSAGRKAEAVEKAESAKKWCWVGAICGVCGVVLAVIYYVLLISLGLFEELAGSY